MPICSGRSGGDPLQSNQRFGLNIDPRNSQDPLVRKALSLWDRVKDSRDEALIDATEFSKTLRLSAHHQAYGWAIATCGRIAAYQEKIDLAESLLIEAVGRFTFVSDSYGKALATSHLAIPQML